jgi:hypothetical protein
LRNADLDLFTQAALLSSIAFVAAAILIRAATFFRRQYARVAHRYPDSWTRDQVSQFERLRRLIGIVILIAWATMQLTKSQMPDGWPFGLEQTIITIGLMLLGYAWLLLLIPSNWEHTLVDKIGFSSTMSLLVLWWAIFLGALLVTIVLAVNRSGAFMLPLGVYA